MASGLVTRNFEELKDTLKNKNHLELMTEKIKESLALTGKRYTGQELDGLLITGPERIIMATHKGPMLAKFDCPRPELEVKYLMKKVEGQGKNSLMGTRGMRMNWFGGKSTLYIDPGSGRGGQEEAGWCDKGVDFTKANSVYTSLVEWLPQVGLGEVDPYTMGGVLDSLSGKDNYTMLFIKGVLLLRTISLGYSVEGSKLRSTDDVPGVVRGDKRMKVSQLGNASCIIDLDRFDDRESLFLLLSSMQYPSIHCSHSGESSVYSRISIPACDVLLVEEYDRKVNRRIPGPEKWWKSMVSVASKLGAIDDLVKAFRCTRGLSGWLDGLEGLGVEEFNMVLECPETRGCKTVLSGSNLHVEDKVSEPSNLVCSLSELICDWSSGVEMRNMLFHVSDEFGTANSELDRNVCDIEGASVGDCLLREAGFFDYGKRNTFYETIVEKFDTRIKVLGDKNIKELIRCVSTSIKKCVSGKHKKLASKLREVKNLGFTAYYGPVWGENSTSYVGEDGKILSSSWGGMSKSRREVQKLRGWMDVYGLSDSTSLISGFNSLQKSGVEYISQGCMDRIKGANGIYNEVYREVNWVSSYEPRLGSETLEKDRLEFVKTYLGMDGEGGMEKEAGKIADLTVPEKDVKKVPEEKKEEKKEEEKKQEKVAKVSEGGSIKLPTMEAKAEFIGSMKTAETVDEGLDVTAKVQMKSNPLKKVSNGKPSAIATFTTGGIHGFLRDVGAPGEKVKVKKIPGDGYCVARALSSGLQELGMNVTDSEVIKYIQKETNEKDWFEVEAAALLMQKLGVGVTVYDTRTKGFTGIGTKGKKVDEIIGITFNGNHCDSLTRSFANSLVDLDGVVTEKSFSDIKHIVEAIFGKEKDKSKG